MNTVSEVGNSSSGCPKIDQCLATREVRWIAALKFIDQCRREPWPPELLVQCRRRKLPLAKVIGILLERVFQDTINDGARVEASRASPSRHSLDCKGIKRIQT